MEQNRGPTNKPTHIQSTDIWQGCQVHRRDKGQPLHKWLGKLDIHKQKKKLSLYITPYAKIYSKWIKNVMKDLKL